MTFLSTFLVFIFLASISVCSSFTECGPYNKSTSTFFICDGGDNITSPGEVQFQLGFFTPKGNLNRYLGIWYRSHPEIIVWVANRDNPLPPNSFGSFGVLNNGDGKLRLMDGNAKEYFSSDTPSNSINTTTAMLKEGGNLVLVDNEAEDDQPLWQSFDYPTDTFLPGMKMTQNLKLQSWRSSTDPSRGNYRFEQDEKGVIDGGCVVMNGSVKYWTGKGQSKNFITGGKIADLTNFLLNNRITNSSNQGKKLIYSNTSSSVLQYPNFSKMRLVMNHSGEIQRWEDKNGWELIWGEPEGRCSVYNTCGKFGICVTSGNDVCRCLDDSFEPASVDSWSTRDYSGGCTRKVSCGKKGNYTFLPLEVIDVEEQGHEIDAKDEEACEQGCRDNKCECNAYFYTSESRRRGSICYLWTSELVDIKVGHGINISVKVINLEPGGETPPNPSQINLRTKSRPREILIISITFSVIAVILLLCSLSYIFYRRTIGRRRESRGKSTQEIQASEVHLRNFSEEDKAKIDVPLFTLESILEATNSFSDANKLGEGGFGPVYKGKFHGGQEIAVKRLSVNSMQGLEELKNEVVLIAKLQHRNLVKLLGYCIQGDESILLYEYMQNKSLDLFIFDQTLSVLLDWEKRFEIVLGVARGLLYLHQDSRLRVIHRDLKVSNILLDEDMNPKISDFGLARIVGGRETESNTNRVVGTYGYMSPEYALEGIFSIKSDVFSFGVVVLEIISGKKNTGFYKAQHDLNLLGHAWRMWKEDNPLGLIDEAVVKNCNRLEVLKCIIIGLLCVQEYPSDRPDMYNVVCMLGSSENASLPNPKQPAFVGRTNEKIGSSSDMSNIVSTNEVTFSRLEPR